MPSNPSQPQSGFRFEDLKFRDEPPQQEREAKGQATEQAAGKYAELTQEAREAERSNEFQSNAFEATRVQAGDEKAVPAQVNGPSEKELMPTKNAAFYGAPGTPDSGPARDRSSPLWEHAYGAGANERRQDNPSGGGKLEFFDQANPGHENDPTHDR